MRPTNQRFTRRKFTQVIRVAELHVHKHIAAKNQSASGNGCAGVAVVGIGVPVRFAVSGFDDKLRAILNARSVRRKERAPAFIVLVADQVTDPFS